MRSNLVKAWREVSSRFSVPSQGSNIFLWFLILNSGHQNLHLLCHPFFNFTHVYELFGSD